MLLPSDVLRSWPVRDFVPSWYTVVMGTGASGLVIARFPYKFSGQMALGWAFWWMAVAQVTLFTLMLALRVALFPSSAAALVRHPLQSMFIATIPMALGTITAGVPVFLAHYWGEGSVNTVGVVLWGVDAGLSVLCGTAIPFYMFTKQEHSLSNMTALWLLPMTPGIVAAAAGGIVAQKCRESHARFIFFTSAFLWGLTEPLAFMLAALYLGRLVVFKLPPKELIVSSFLPGGVISMGALALLSLGTVALREDLGLPYTPAFEDGTTFAALLLWGAAAWWMLLAVVSVASTFHALRFNSGWWGFIFPNCAFTLVTISLSTSEKLNLGGLKIIGAALAVLTLMLWCLVAALTVRHAVRGHFAAGPCLDDCSEISMAPHLGDKEST